MDGLAVPVKKLEGMHPALLSRALVRLMDRAGIRTQSADAIGAVMAAIESGEITVNLSGGAHAHAGKTYLCLTRADEAIADTPLNVPGRTATLFGEFVVRPALEGETGDGKRTQRMPLALLQGAYVSARREGDAMVPFGRKTPVRLKKLMIDAHVEHAMRKSMPLVRDAQGEILWAVGMRPAGSCRGAADEEQMIVHFCGAWPCADEE